MVYLNSKVITKHTKHTKRGKVTMQNEINKLKEIGCTEIETFKLINNYGYKF